jgi:hypothetical protein
MTMVRNVGTAGLMLTRGNANKSPVSITMGQMFVAVGEFDGTNATLRVNASVGTAESSTGTFGVDRIRMGVGDANLTGFVSEFAFWFPGLAAGERATAQARSKAYFGTP